MLPLLFLPALLSCLASVYTMGQASRPFASLPFMGLTLNLNY